MNFFRAYIKKKAKVVGPCTRLRGKKKKKNRARVGLIEASKQDKKALQLTHFTLLGSFERDATPLKLSKFLTFLEQIPPDCFACRVPVDVRFPTSIPT